MFVWHIIFSREKKTQKASMKMQLAEVSIKKTHKKTPVSEFLISKLSIEVSVGVVGSLKKVWWCKQTYLSNSANGLNISQTKLIYASSFLVNFFRSNNSLLTSNEKHLIENRLAFSSFLLINVLSLMFWEIQYTLGKYFDQGIKVTKETITHFKSRFLLTVFRGERYIKNFSKNVTCW